MTQPTSDSSAYFSDPAALASYADRTRRLVPGWDDMQRMAALLVAERSPHDANVLVVGAGGGVELKVFAQRHAQWRFLGVDPSQPMLDLAEATLGPLMARVTLHHGVVETAPDGPFDAATCLLTMHFLTLDERKRTLAHIRRRLKPGAPYVMAHLSIPRTPAEQALWISRYVAWAISSGVDRESAQTAATAIAQRLPLLDPGEEETLLQEAGFAQVQLFYVGLAFRGWVAQA